MKQTQRRQNLLPNNTPKWIRAYDNQGQTMDRYTVCFTFRNAGGLYLSMSEHPTSPQGFGMHGEGKNGRSIDTNKWGFAPMIGRKNHLGKRIPFSELPPDCQKLVLSDYKEIWNLE
jgi:hypothetical protein